MEERGYVPPVELVPAGRPSAPADPCKTGNSPVVGPAVPESTVGGTSALPSVPEISAAEASTTVSPSVTVVPASVLFADALKDLPKVPSDDKSAVSASSNITLEPAESGAAESGEETGSDAEGEEDSLPVKKIKVEQENTEVEVVGSDNTNGE